MGLIERLIQGNLRVALAAMDFLFSVFVSPLRRCATRPIQLRACSVEEAHPLWLREVGGSNPLKSTLSIRLKVIRLRI